MKRLSLAVLCSALLHVPASAGLREDFVNPPPEIKVGCYYYWVNERVDPVGVRKDLEWMKTNGITRAFLATDIRNLDEPQWEGQLFGENEFMSDYWWENLRTALKVAGELGIEMGIFNCPGWSQSGGPWVKPEEAMRNYVGERGTGNGELRITWCVDAIGRNDDRVLEPKSPKLLSLALRSCVQHHRAFQIPILIQPSRYPFLQPLLLQRPRLKHPSWSNHIRHMPSSANHYTTMQRETPQAV